MTLLTQFFDVLIVEVAVSVVFRVKTTMSLFTDLHPYLLSLVYPQIGWESNALSFFPCCVAAHQSADFFFDIILCKFLQ